MWYLWRQHCLMIFSYIMWLLIKSVTTLYFMNFWFIVYGTPQCNAQDDSNMTVSKPMCFTHCNSPLAHKSTLCLQKHGSEMMAKMGLSFSLTGSKKMNGACALTQKVASSPCSDSQGIAQALKGDNGFFHLLFPGTVVGDPHSLDHLCLTTETSRRRAKWFGMLHPLFAGDDLHPIVYTV